MANLQNTVIRLWIIVFTLTYDAYPSEQPFEAVTVKLSLNAITTKKIADFQNSVTRL